MSHTHTPILQGRYYTDWLSDLPRTTLGSRSRAKPGRAVSQVQHSASSCSSSLLRWRVAAVILFVWGCSIHCRVFSRILCFCLLEASSIPQVWQSKVSSGNAKCPWRGTGWRGGKNHSSWELHFSGGSCVSDIPRWHPTTLVFMSGAFTFKINWQIPNLATVLGYSHKWSLAEYKLSPLFRPA